MSYRLTIINDSSNLLMTCPEPAIPMFQKLLGFLAKTCQKVHISSFMEVSLYHSLQQTILMGISVSDRKMNSLLAKALHTDLNKSVQLSMKKVSYLVGDDDVA